MARRRNTVVGYRPVTGSQLKQEDVDILAPEFARLSKQYGGMNTREFLREASNPQSPIYPYLEWNNRAAAEQYRLSQIRKLARSILVVWTTADGNELKTRLFVNVVVREATDEEAASYESPGGGIATQARPLQRYVLVTQATEDQDLLSQIQQQAMQEARTFRQKYQFLSTEAPDIAQQGRWAAVWRAIDQL